MSKIHHESRENMRYQILENETKKKRQLNLLLKLFKVNKKPWMISKENEMKINVEMELMKPI